MHRYCSLNQLHNGSFLHVLPSAPGFTNVRRVKTPLSLRGSLHAFLVVYCQRDRSYNLQPPRCEVSARPLTLLTCLKMMVKKTSVALHRRAQASIYGRGLRRPHAAAHCSQDYLGFSKCLEETGTEDATVLDYNPQRLLLESTFRESREIIQHWVARLLLDQRGLHFYMFSLFTVKYNKDFHQYCRHIVHLLL